MIQLHKQHKANYIKDELLKCLKSYEIDVKQIYSSTTDNGANVLKASKLLQDLQEEQADDDGEEMRPEEEYDENVRMSVASILSIVRCAAHTLQLAAYDVLKELDAKVCECRSAVKKLRTFARGHCNVIPIPCLDNSTRWNSTFLMLQHLRKARGNIEVTEAGDITVDWEFVDNFVTAFSPLEKCTRIMQKEQYIIGDFYRDWLNCEIEVEETLQKTPYAALLLNSLQNRRSVLVANNAFVAGLYMDPRFNHTNTQLLTEEQKSRALV